MERLLPEPFLFRFAFPVQHVAKLPRKGKQPLALADECRLPDITELLSADEGQHVRGRRFADVRLAWNDGGLGISVAVRGTSRFPFADDELSDASDGLQFWLDTRNTQNIHRASRFCHHFCVSTVGGGRDGQQPRVTQRQIARAREETALAKLTEVVLWSESVSDGYTLEAWFPASTLHGYDPAASPRLGFYYIVRDATLGTQHLSIGETFPFDVDPSLWSTLELVRET